MMYLFELGSHPELSQAEIAHVLSRYDVKFSVKKCINSFLFLEVTQEIDAVNLMGQLGGTIKIAKKITDTTKPVEAIASHLTHTTPEGKIAFSISGHASKRLGIQVKKHIKSLGRSVRYIEPKNTATILHNNLVEKQSDLTLIDQTLFVTEAIQPIESFSERDYEKPGRDAKSGMLPPKLARMMINLTGTSHEKNFLDPFCGSGTVLMEAALLGFNHIIGSDLSEKAVEDSKKNMHWIVEQQLTKKLPDTTIIHSDVAHLSNRIDHTSVDAIATEPFMGVPKNGTETKQFLEQEARELAQLYIQAFTSFKKILAPNAVVIFIIPQFRFQNDWIVPPCLEDIKKLGFVPEPLLDGSPSLLYWRNGQFVGRNIWKFRKK